LQGCDIVYRLEKGRIASVGSYQELIAAESPVPAGPSSAMGRVA